MGFSLPTNLTGQGLFFAILHYKMRERPTQAWAWPELGSKN
jgi:hypothetical protein